MADTTKQGDEKMENVANVIIDEITRAQKHMDDAQVELDHGARVGAVGGEYWQRQVSFYRGMILGLEKAYFADGIQRTVGNTRTEHVAHYENEVGYAPDRRARDRQDQLAANRNSPRTVSERGYSVD
jgi:hypothetical protein